MPTRHGSVAAKKRNTSKRRNRRPTATAPVASTPWIWKTYLA